MTSSFSVALLTMFAFGAFAINLRKDGRDDTRDEPLVRFDDNPESLNFNLERSGTKACMTQSTWDNYFMSEVLKNVGMGNYSTDHAQAWNAYQEKLVQKLLKDHPAKHQKKALKVLVVQAVHDDARVVQDFEANMQRLQDNSFKDSFEYALFHHDSSNSEWTAKKWYNSRNSPIVMKQLGPGCKPQFWQEITPKIAKSYDYIWLLDEDIRLDFLSWDFYRTVLSTLEPLVSQPVIIPKEPYKRSTGVTKLRMVVPSGNTFPIAYETQRSEVQAPVISAKIWAAVHERNAGNDRTNDWYIDDFWDVVANLARVKCRKTAILAVNAAPVRHMDCHNLFKKGSKCTEGCGPNKENCRPVSSAEEQLVREALEDVGCDVSKNWVDGMCRNEEIHDCHSHLGAKFGKQTWSMDLDL